MIIGTLTCSMLAGCGSTTEELPKEGTVVETQETEKNEVVNAETPSDTTTDTATATATATAEETVTAVLPEGTFVREVKDGFIKEIQSGDGKSTYKIAYGNAQVTGTESDLCITFNSIPNIGSWTDELEDSGVWRYIKEDEWFTAVVWAAGYTPEVRDIPDEKGRAITIDKSSIEDIKSLLNVYTVFEDTLELRTADNYAAATVKVDRVDAGLSGYVTIIDDFETGLRWIVQFLMLSESADMDLLHESAKSVAIGTDFDRASLSEEAKVSTKPLVISNEMSKTPESTDASTEETVESTTETVEQPTEETEETVETATETETAN